MSTIASKAEVLAALKAKAADLGVALSAADGDSLRGKIEAIRSKWWFGGRTAVYRMSCQMAEPEHVVLFREAVVEKSWGLPPPTLTVETESTSGWERSGTRKDVSIGGGGTLEFAAVRTAFQEAAAKSGWQLRLEGGKMPS